MTNTTLSSSAYFPWSWTIQSTNPTVYKCPTVSSLLGTFATVNGVVSALAVIFGHRLVVKRISCGLLGKRGSRSWTWMWIVPVGLQLAANVFIAILIKNSAGYAADFNISEMMLFLVARPRLSWIVLGAFAFKSQKSRRNTEKPIQEPQHYIPIHESSQYSAPQPYHDPWASNAHSTPYTSQAALSPYFPGYRNVPAEEYAAEAPRGHGYWLGHRDFPWWSAFMAQFIGEFVLQIITLYIMGRTAHFATNHGYYNVFQDAYAQLPHAARMMYSGALYYLVAGSLFLIFAFMFILYAMFSDRSKYFGKASSFVVFVTLLFLLVSTWMGSWIFWAGFVKLAGEAYCPPKLIHQGVIWTFFSAIGILLGVGV